MSKANLVLLLVVVALAAAGVVGYRMLVPADSAEGTLLPEGLGSGAADAVATALGRPGKVVLIVPQRGNFKDPVIELQRAAFAKTLGRVDGMTLLATEIIETERPGTMGAGGMDPEQFLQFVQRHADARAIVSLAGLPDFPDASLAKFADKKLVIVGTVSPRLKSLLIDGVVQAAIIPRLRPVAADTKPPRTASEWFARTYEVIVPATAGSLP